MSSLADAIIYDRTEEVVRLLEAGADVNEIDQYGYTPLIEAAICNHPHLAKILLEHGAKIDEPDVTGGTALHWAVENNNVAFCEQLLELKADPNIYTSYGQSPLVKPLLRRQQELKELLYEFGADLKFAQDYINAKLIGHRFSLVGRVDIVDHLGRFFEIDFEGFILEFTVNLIQESLMQFKNNFSARNLRDYFKQFQKIIDAYTAAAELLKYQQYMIDINEYQHRIEQLLKNELLLIPMGYEGHAISFIKFGNWLAKCDRGENSRDNPTVAIYRVNRPQACTINFLKDMFYKKHSKYFVTEGIFNTLALEYIIELPLSPQSSGNCSWANIEAAFPTMLLTLMLRDKTMQISEMEKNKETVLAIYEQWQEWDKDWALHQCVESFYDATPARKASKAAILAAVLFQTCDSDDAKLLLRINKIMAVLKTPGYEYVLKSYVEVFTRLYPNHKAGKNLLELIDIYGG